MKAWTWGTITRLLLFSTGETKQGGYMMDKVLVALLIVLMIVAAIVDGQRNDWKVIALTNANAVTELLVISQRQSKLINEQKEILTILTRKE